MNMVELSLIIGRSPDLIVVIGDQLSKLAYRGKKMEEGHSRLKGRRDNPKQMYVVLHSRHSWLYTSAADTEENVTSELEFLITLGDVFH